MLELVTISNTGSEWYLNKAIINPNHIVMVTESREHNSLLKEGKIELGFNPNISFSKVQMAAISGFSELIVVGSPSSIMEKINKNKNLKDKHVYNLWIKMVYFLLKSN